MKRRSSLMIGAVMAAAAFFCTGVSAAVPESDVTRAYDDITSIQEKLDSINVTIKETTTVPGIRDNAQKTIDLKASGLLNPKDLIISVNTETSEGSKEEYYKDGYYYTTDSGEKVKYPMKPENMISHLNYYIYIDLNSSALASLEYENGVYNFTATSETLGTFKDKILEGTQADQMVDLVSLQGYITTNDKKNITRSCIQTVYTIRSGDEPQTCTSNTISTYHDPGEPADVAVPDLSAYSEPKAKDPVVEVKDETGIVYAADDLNVRAQNNVSSTVLGGIPAGDEITKTGVTSDGWIRIDYNGTPAYVSADFVSPLKPVIVKAMSGTMYATTSVNVRDKAGTDGNIIGILSAGEAVSTTGYTDNSWIRINYQGQTAYVTQSCMSWDMPVTSMGGTMYVINSNANVRSYYSTDSSVLGTLSYGDPVQVTGYTSNNWIRVRYSGSTGYIYGDLLSWTDPVDHDPEPEPDYDPEPSGRSTPRQSFGTVVSSGMSTITIACTNGKTISLNKESANMNCPLGLFNGMYVSIVYHYSIYTGEYMLEALDAIY